MSKLRVKLVAPGNQSFVGHHIAASYFHRVPLDGDTETLEVPGAAIVAVDADGHGILELPEKEALVAERRIALRILAPDGEVLETKDESVNTVDGDRVVEIRVEPKEFFPIEPNTDQAYLKPGRIRGLVVDPSGQGQVGNRQVILRAKPAGRGADDASHAVAVSRTDGRGYFSAPFPLGTFTKASGIVSGGSPVPIALNADGSFPDRLVLGIELSSEGEERPHECECKSDVPRDPDAEDLVSSPGTYSTDVGGGHCVDITKPNRVLEEFDFYTVVRTTEPQIKGLTVKEPPKINLNDIIRIIDPKILTFALRSQPEVRAVMGTARSTDAASRRTPEDVRSTGATIDFSNINALRSAAVELQPELEHLSEVVGLASLRLAAAQPTAGPQPVTAAPSSPTGITNDAAELAGVRIEAEIARTLARDPDGFSLTRLASAEILTRKNDLVRVLDLIKRGVPQRGSLSCSNPVDWDDEPTFYQACTIAHGHLLHLKQEWVADGYSLGDLLYSLPLAPCQKKQIAVVDWDRRESAARRESLEEQEFLSAQLSRDRDISEIANAAVRETMSGGSEASTRAFGGGLGIGGVLFGGAGALGGLLGIGGGTSGASSSAWQNSSRSSSATSLQQLRDRTQQSAAAVRSQRSTVVQTVRQGETMRVQTEVVANHNHCHAITIQYFEVLRHFLVRQRLADVQECLLVPLLMTRFDSAKARRWHEPLMRYLRNRQLARGFDALRRIADNYVGTDMPSGSYAAEQLVYLDGFIRIQFRIQRPRDNSDGSFLEASWNPLAWLGISPNEWWRSFLENQQQRDRTFAEVLGPRIAEEIANGLRFYAVDEHNNETLLPVDSTLVTDFRNDQPLYVSLRLAAGLPPLRRDQIKFIRIDTTIDTKAGPRNIDDILPTGSKIIVHSGQMGYRTPHLAHSLFDQSRILNDLSGTDGVMIFTPLSRQELRRPREEDKEYANSLLKHLNDHLEHYHRAIWWSMDAQRRYLLLDGFIAPNTGDRSVASVVENRLVGIIGNCLVMPVARGFHLDPTFSQDEDNPVDLLDHYQPTTPIAPLRLTVPTKGVFAESVMGSCNSCEPKDESRFWRWEESPCPNDPAPIQPISTESRRAEPPDLTAKDFPAPIVAFQNVPAAPDPQGFGSLVQLLSNPNLFRDVTGLTENQRNALASLQAALGTAQFFGGKAADLALQDSMNKDIDKALNKINEQHAAGAINDQQQSQLTEAALRGMIGGGTQAPAKPMTTDEVQKLTNTAGVSSAAVRVNRPGGEAVEVNARPPKGLEDHPARTIIILPAPESDPDSRSFFPSRQDKGGVSEMVADVRNAPSGASHRWTRPDSAAITVESPESLRTRILGLRPGLTTADFTVRDSAGSPLASQKVRLCVPQFVTIDEEAAAFDPVLAAIHLSALKNAVIREAKLVCDHLLRTSNVRTIWRIGPFAEVLPAHMPPANVTALTIRGEPPAGSPNLLGRTNLVGGTAGAAVFNETIDIFPGAYDNPIPPGGSEDLDVETQALVLQLEAATFTDPQLESLAVRVFGRLIGETMAHEVVHSLLAFEIPSGHNAPSIPNDLMNRGSERSFRQRTGIEDTARVSPIDPANFIDHGIASIGGLQAVNQARMDARFPVPPSFT